MRNAFLVFRRRSIIPFILFSNRVFAVHDKFHRAFFGVLINSFGDRVVEAEGVAGVHGGIGVDIRKDFGVVYIDAVAEWDRAQDAAVAGVFDGGADHQVATLVDGENFDSGFEVGGKAEGLFFLELGCVYGFTFLYQTLESVWAGALPVNEDEDDCDEEDCQ